MYPQCSDSVGSVRNAMVTPHRAVSHKSAAFLQGDSAVLQLLTNHARVLLHNPGLHPHTPHTHAGILNIFEMKNIFKHNHNFNLTVPGLRDGAEPVPVRSVGSVMD